MTAPVQFLYVQYSTKLEKNYMESKKINCHQQN